MVFIELLAEREVLIDLQFFMGLYKLFSMCQYPRSLLIVDTIMEVSVVLWHSSLVLVAQNLTSEYVVDNCADRTDT